MTTTATQPTPTQTTTPAPPSRLHHISTVIAAILLAALALAWWAWRWWLLPTRPFDPDEFEHLHAAFSISRGMLPYVDFFEHHTPLLHYTLQPLFWTYDVATNPDHAVAAIITARRLMWILTLALIALTAWLGVQRRDWPTGLAAAVLTLATNLFLEKSLEIRPDLLGTPFMLAGIALLVAAIRAEKKPARWFLASGIAFALAILSTQKTLFVGPGIAAAFLLYLADPRSPHRFLPKLRHTAAALAGLALPFTATAAWFYAHAGSTGVYRFYELNFLLNSQWKARLPIAAYGTDFLRDSPLLIALGLAGLAHAAITLLSTTTIRRGNYVAPLATASLLAGLYIMPVPYRQYYMQFVPLLALLAATALSDLLRTVESTARDLRRTRWYAHLSNLLLLALITTAAYVVLRRYATYPLLVPDTRWWYAALAAALLLPILRLRHLALIALVCVISLPGYRQMRQQFAHDNKGQLNAIRYVITSTAPTDTVMDGWTGFGVFRPHAWYYWFLHWEIREMLPHDARHAFVNDVRAGRTTPALVIMDGDVQSLSPELTAHLRKHYRPAHGPIWRPRNPKPPAP